VTVDHIPGELRQRDQWVTWRFEERDGKRTKPPLRPNGDGYASADDPATWGTFDEAQATVEAGRAQGIGYVFAADDPYCGVDLDDCRNGTGLTSNAAGIVLHLDSYTEWSPSGTGVHILLRAALPGTRRRKGHVEMYDRARYFCVTGDHMRGCPATIEERQTKLDQLYAMLFPPEEDLVAIVSRSHPVDLDDRELLERAFAARNGAVFERLWNGDVNGYASHSEADLALASHLAFWTQADAARIDTLFRRSGLMRDKWDSSRGDATYGSQTVEKAIQGASEVYDPGLRPAAVNPVSRGPSGLIRASESVESVGGFRGADGQGQGLTDSPTPIGVVSRVSASPCEPVVEETDSAAESVPAFALPLEEFIAAKSTTPAALIGDEGENLLPAFGLAILFAKGGKGKTTMIVDAVLHFASGITWLGFEVGRPLNVLFIENEGPREPFRAKFELKRKLWSHDLTGSIFVQTFDWGAFTLADEEYAGRLRSFVEENQIDLVIGDPLDSLGVDGVGSPEDTRKFMALMSRAGLNQTVAFLLLHHPRKEDARDELDEVSGAWGGKPDTMLRLEKLDGDRARLSFPKIRWSRRGTRRAYILAFDPDTENFSIAHEEEDEERDYAAEVAKLLGDSAPLTPKEIAAPKKDGGIGANVDTIKKVLEERPDVFESRTGDAAKELGRSPQATLWQLRKEAQENVA
jgi:putative DNA primase/helicase